MKVQRIVSKDAYTPPSGTDEDVLWVAEMSHEFKGKMYIPSDLLRHLLEQQARMGCHCGELCNFGVRETTARGVKVYVNCHKNKGIVRGKADGECGYFGTAVMNSGYFWKYGVPPPASATSSSSSPAPVDAAPRKRPREEVPQAPVVGTGLTFPCPACKYRPVGWDAMSEEKKRVVEAVIKSLLYS